MEVRRCSGAEQQQLQQQFPRDPVPAARCFCRMTVTPCLALDKETVSEVLEGKHLDARDPGRKEQGLPSSDGVTAAGDDSRRRYRLTRVRMIGSGDWASFIGERP